MVTATMHISGGHVNPAVTIGQLVARKIDGANALLYSGSQLLGVS
jgi:glycerol uptake facilitator-like aquaporin